MKRLPRKAQGRTPMIKVSGLTASDLLIDGDEAAQRAVIEYQRTAQLEEKRRTQHIEIDTDQPFGIVWLADVHAGSSGTDYERLFKEIEIINGTPGLYIGTVGDLVDNFILTKLAFIRHDTRLNISDEWAIVRKILKAIAPKHLIAVGGNHDHWTRVMSGIDYFHSVLNAISPTTLYDSDDCRFTLKAGHSVWPGRVRHRWRGSSIYNPTHGMERAYAFDHDFVFAVGAHTHVSGLARQFNASGRATGLAVLCGAYKRTDPHAITMGFPTPNRSTAMTIMFDPATGSMTGFDNLETAAKTIGAFRR